MEESWRIAARSSALLGALEPMTARALATMSGGVVTV
jgi:hypothetical protein